MRSWDSSVSIVTRLTGWTVQSLDLGVHNFYVSPDQLWGLGYQG